MKNMIDTIDLSAGIYAMPAIHARLNVKLNEPYASNTEIANLIALDPGLSLVVLKLVNSAIYGFAGTISSITQAVTIMGRKELSVLLLSAGVSALFRKLPIDQKQMNRHWQHSLLCGLIAKYLPNGENNASSLFIAGLLHDIGKPVIWHQFPEQANVIYLTEDGDDAIQRERDQLGFTHAELGHRLMLSWQLPDLLRTTTLWHHDPLSAEQYGQACRLIHIANRLSHQDDIDLTPAMRTFCVELGLSDEALETARLQAQQALSEIAGLFLA